MDYSTWYQRISQPFRERGAARAIGFADRALVIAFAVAYILLLVVLFATGSPSLGQAIVVPAATFAIVTVIRALVNRPRPYEAHRIDPLVAKDTRGKSMPSRHMASATIITFSYCLVFPVVGGMLCAGCIGIAFTRIVGGVHYPSDIAAAVALALACGAAGLAFL